ncbi:MAG: malonyl-CoA synthase, partial [Henriciella sp.]|nr:malonyl-CoA synthase [Henriciella sp.]
MTNPLYDTLFGRHVGQATAFLHMQDGKTIRHDAFMQTVGRYADTLTRAGLVAGDRVAVQIDKSPEALAVYGACVQAGLVFLPLNTAYTPDEVTYFLEDSGAAMFICQPRRRDQLSSIASRTGVVLETLAGDGTGTFTERARSASPEFATVPRSGDDLAALLYTSGTTGRSKGAMLSQDNLLSNARTLVEIWRFTDRDVLLHALPIFHTHGLFVASNVTLMAGGSMIFLPRFDLDAMIANMAPATTMMGVPTFYTRLLDDPRFSAELTGHMRLFISGSAPLLAETHTRFKARTGHRILERYGMTETSMNTSNPYEGDRRAGTVGFALPGVELIVTDPDTGDALMTDEVGMIEVRGPNVFSGYWKMPEKTAEELRENGFFITGDLGRMDEDGYVHIVGRSKDLIISGGFNIYPKEIEDALNEIGGIVESAVIGVPHGDFGEGVVAVIVPQRAGVALAPQEDIIATLGKRLAKFKLPKRIYSLDELPRN